MKRWRLIMDGRQSGEYNMSADAFLLRNSEKKSAQPSLRIYDWEKPSITIGYHQQIAKAVDQSLLGSTPVIRRITGGRALFHNDQSLTYAVAGNFITSPELGQTIGDSYIEISNAILAFFTSLGVPARMSQRDRPVSLSRNHGRQKACFSAVSRWEITCDGRKLAAGSQRRTRTALMQHGVILVGPSQGHPALNDLSQSSGRHEVIDAGPVRSNLIHALVDSFSKSFGVEYDIKSFDRSEIETIERGIKYHKNLNLSEKLIEQ